MSKSKSVSNAVLEYLERISKPDNLQGISNCLIDYGKSDVMKALAKLVENERVIEKAYGKQKIYFANQKQLNKGKQVDEAELNRLLAEKRDALRLVESQIKQKENQLKEFDGKLSRENFEKEMAAIRAKMDAAQAELDEEEKKRSEKEQIENKHKNLSFEKVSSECRKRKRITKDIIESLLEFQPKSKKQLLEEIGIERYD